jgi:hypothetical protein
VKTVEQAERDLAKNLAEIRDKGLYRCGGYPSFEAFLKGEFSSKKYRIMNLKLLLFLYDHDGTTSTTP